MGGMMTSLTSEFDDVAKGGLDDDADGEVNDIAAQSEL